MYLIYLVEDEDITFPSDTFVSMNRAKIPVGQIYDSQYETNWIQTPSSYINQLSSDNDKENNFPSSKPRLGIGKMKKNSPLLSEPGIFILEVDPTMLNDFKENLVTMVSCI